MNPNLYAPRIAARLYVSEAGTPTERIAQSTTTQTYALDVRPIRARWESNSWRQADTLELIFSADEAPSDPRVLRSAEVYVWLADAVDPFVPTDDDLRFVGIVRDVERAFDMNAKTLKILALDYTTLLLESQFPPSHVPSFSDTLTQAWQKICRWSGHLNYGDDGLPVIVSSICDPDSAVGAFDGQPRIPLVALGSVDLTATLGSSVPARIAKLGSIVHQTGKDSWATWCDIVSAMGLITYIRGSACIVTSALDFYTAGDPPLFVYGQNVLSLVERRDLSHVSSLNLHCMSYDGLAGTSIESFFPPRDSPLARKYSKKVVLPSAKKDSKAAISDQPYETIFLQIPVTSQANLDAITETLWFERVRQELSGTLTTREMRVSTVSQAAITNASGEVIAPGRENFDCLRLQAGDNIQVQIASDALDNIQSLTNDSDKLAALEARGYSADVSQYIVANLASLTGPAALPPLFLVHSCDVEFDSNQNSYEMRVEFINALDVSGAALINEGGQPVIAGTPVAPVPNVSPGGTIIDAGEIDNPFTDAGEL